MQYKIGDKYWINYGGEPHLAEIIKISESDRVNFIEYRISFNGKEISYLAKIFGFYHNDFESERVFTKRLINN